MSVKDIKNATNSTIHLCIEYYGNDDLEAWYEVNGSIDSYLDKEVYYMDAIDDSEIICLIDCDGIGPDDISLW